MAKCASIHTLADVVAEFLAVKESARGLSRRNIKSLTCHLDSLRTHLTETVPIATLTPQQIEAWINEGAKSGRTRKNRRGAVVTLFRWARSRRYLPDETTAAERTERPIVRRGVPETFTPAELAAMWAVCPESHRPWFALAAWAGLRNEEMYQEDSLSGKDVVRWRDLSSGHLEIRPNVAKTGVRRIVPLCPSLATFLVQERARRADEADAVAVCLGRLPSHDLNVINKAHHHPR